MSSPHPRWITALVGFGFALGAAALYLRDIEQESFEEEHGTPIGVVTESNEDVSRRSARRLLWNALGPQRSVYARDTIRTGVNSSVKIDLRERGFLELRGESLVVLELNADQVRVNLASGELFAKGPLVAQVGGTEFRPEAGVIQIRQNRATGKTEIKKNQSITKPVLVVDRKALVEEPAEAPPEINWLSPEPAVLEFNEKGLSLNLDWSTLKFNHSSVLRVTGENLTPFEQSFSKDHSIRWNQQKLSLWMSLMKLSKVPHELSVTVEALASNSQRIALSPEKKIRIRDLRAAQTPFKATLKADSSDLRNTRLAWETHGPETEFEIMWSDRSLKVSGFNRPVNTKDVYSALIKNPSALRIRALSAAEGPPSEWRPFTVDHDSLAIAALSQKPPAPRYPMMGTTLVARNHSQIRFYWKSESSTLYHPLEYEIVISGSPPFEDIQKQLPESKLAIPVPLKGLYSWKVRARWQDFGWGPYSNLQQFSLSGGAALPPPLMRRPATAEQRGSYVED